MRSSLGFKNCIFLVLSVLNSWNTVLGDIDFADDNDEEEVDDDGVDSDSELMIMLTMVMMTTMKAI